MSKKNPLKQRMIDQISERLLRYASSCSVTDGIHLTSDVQKGFLSAKHAEDEALLAWLVDNRGETHPSPSPLFQFVRLAKKGVFEVNEAAVHSHFERAGV